MFAPHQGQGYHAAPSTTTTSNIDEDSMANSSFYLGSHNINSTHLSNHHNQQQSISTASITTSNTTDLLSTPILYQPAVFDHSTNPHHPTEFMSQQSHHTPSSFYQPDILLSNTNTNNANTSTSIHHSYPSNGSNSSNSHNASSNNGHLSMNWNPYTQHNHNHHQQQGSNQAGGGDQFRPMLPALASNTHHLNQNSSSLTPYRGVASNTASLHHFHSPTPDGSNNQHGGMFDHPTSSASYYYGSATTATNNSNNGPEMNKSNQISHLLQNHHQQQLPPRAIGLPATTQLGPGVNVPRRKPTLLSRDPSQPILYCKFCLQPFSRRNSLRRHEQLHSGHKPYQCRPCGRSFSRQDIFKRHCASRRCMRLTLEMGWADHKC